MMFFFKLKIVFVLAIFCVACAPKQAVLNESDDASQQMSANSTSVVSDSSIVKYPYPLDYKHAYEYRTGVPYEQVAGFIQNVQNDSLRINDTEKYVTKLVLMIDSVAKDDFEKVKMIYDALSLLLDYDIEGLTNHSEISSEWDDVLVSKKAVCAGYAATFKKLCDLLKIPCEIVHGYARGLTPVSSNEELVPNHAWNIVKIKDFWYNVDCTWGSNSFDSRTSESVHRYTTDWLFLNGEHFGYTHFPMDSNYQLIATKINQEKFKNRPRLDPAFFENVNSWTELNAANVVDSSFQLNLSFRKNANIVLVVFDKETNQPLQDKVLLRRGDDGLHVEFQAPYSGEFLGVLMNNVKEDTYNGCAYFLIRAQKASSVQYPRFLRSSAKGVVIESPLVTLHADSTYEFRVKVPNKKYVLLYCNGKKNRLNSLGDGYFTKRIKIPQNAKEVILEASDSEYGQYEGIAKYSIDDTP